MTIDQIKKELEKLSKSNFSEYSYVIEKHDRDQYRGTSSSGISQNMLSPNSIAIKYEIGGISGGSCWETSNPQSYHLSSRPNTFKELYYPIIKLLHELNVFNDAFLYIDTLFELSNKMKVAEQIDREYYGNCTNYDVEILLISDILSIINHKRERNLI